jgi:hypothetical protein
MKATLHTSQPTAVRAYLAEIGRKGAAVRQLSQADRLLGVKVRLLKKSYLAQGYAPEAAHAKARATFRISPGGVLSR